MNHFNDKEKLKMRPKPIEFDEKEKAVLSALYAVPDGTYSSYALAWKLNPMVEIGTPNAVTAFTDTRDATERLIARGLLRGNRFSGADGVYFESLRLTPKGEQMAIKQKNEDEHIARGIAALAEAVSFKELLDAKEEP
jgi:hypothetical protein